MPQFHIRLAGDDLIFSAGHFITLAGGLCERLHGHTYRVAAEIYGPLGAEHYVVDFLTVGNALKGIVAELDHRMLLPTRHPAIHVASGTGEVEVAFAERRWLFPQDDCLLLPMANTTTELLAHYVGVRLLAALVAQGETPPAMIRIEIGEGTGASAVCELPGENGKDAVEEREKANGE
jgi:6-pyruvoyltetrahydropterin/6-carboxytetrahydropterin synthase